MRNHRIKKCDWFDGWVTPADIRLGPVWGSHGDVVMAKETPQYIAWPVVVKGPAIKDEHNLYGYDHGDFVLAITKGGSEWRPWFIRVTDDVDTCWHYHKGA